MTDDDVRRQIDQLLCKNFDATDVTASPAVIDLEVLPNHPAQLLQPLQECRVALLYLRIVGGLGHQCAHAPHPLRLLRMHRKRPRSGAAECCDKVSPSHCLAPVQ